MNGIPKCAGVMKAAAAAAFVACAQTPPADAPPGAAVPTKQSAGAPTPPVASTSAQRGARPGETARRCDPGPPVERVEVAVGKTAVTSGNLAVTFEGASHDNYGNGRTDLLLNLVFQGVMDDGTLTPSALGWMPSAYAKPAWAHLAVNVCARVVEADFNRVVLELFRPAQDTK